MRETSGGVAIDFIYDADGRPFAMKRNGAYYYYILNLQGDVVMLVNASGATVASYEYDPYGKVISATGSMAAINPLRYRGYYYDQETGLYFLMSRYYDPAICRFINADSFASTGQGILGYNMFAYCRNNPVNGIDQTGCYPVFLFEEGFFDEEFRQIGEAIGRALRDYLDKQREISNTLTYKSNRENSSAKIIDSYKVTSPIVMYEYVNEHRGGEISGSTTGVVAEWVVHNVAHEAGRVLTKAGYVDVGQSLMAKGKDLDIGSTIYQDDHGILSVGMWGVYLITAPIHSRVDLIIELFK